MRTDREKRMMEVQRLLPYMALTVLTAVILFLPVPEGEIFGSEGDWYSQHTGAAEAIRQTMLRQKTVFPQHAGLGGGINAYDLAYYGLLRPDVLLSYFLPDVPMRRIISVYAAAEVFASVNLTFFWLKRKRLDTASAFCGGVLTAAAACFFHAHHQIIFVNYMPFLVMAFLGTDRLLSEGKSGILTISVFLVCIHSFYYAPACLLVCLIYGLHQLGSLKQEGINPPGGFGACVFRGVSAAVSGVCLSAVLLLPAGLDILSTAKDAGGFLKEPMKAADLSFESLLYQPYGCGMTLTALYCLILSLGDKKKRRLAAVLLTILAVPAIWFVLSGFLYPRAKILIPLVPLLAWICADTLEAIYKGKQKPHVPAAVLCLVPVFFAAERGEWGILLYLDGGLLLVFTGLQYLKKLPERVKRKSIALLLLVPVCTGLCVNFFLEDYLAEDDGRQSRFSFADITMFASEPGYRFDYLANGYINSNVLPDGALNKTACYLSVSSDIYGRFFYDTMRNPISLRNRVVLMPGANPLFNWFMGIRYILAPENRVPYGYRAVFRRNGFVLAENENVLPVCYGTDRLISGKELKHRDFPENAAALCGVAVQREDEESFFSGNFPQSFEKASAPGGASYGRCLLPLSEPLENRVLILCFDVSRRDGREVCISINGMKNNLSSESAPYPNGNTAFTFVLAPENGGKVLDCLDFEFSEGDYHIENLQVFTAGMPSVSAAHIWRAEPDSKGGKEFTFAKGSPVFSGTVQMEKEGYFVTSYPYKRGYRISADGKTVPAEKVNGAFTGVPLKEGKHAVEITYTAPGFRAGLCISVATLAFFLLSALPVQRRRRYSRSGNCGRRRKLQQKRKFSVRKRFHRIQRRHERD